MSNKEQEGMKKTAQCPKVEKILPSDDSKNPDAVSHVDNPTFGTSEMGSHSSGSDVQEVKEPVQKRMQDFEGDVTQFLTEKRKQFEKDVNASFRSLNEKLQGILKAQQKSRRDLN